MVWSQGGDAERPPLSVILPRLYLGAERDVTQEQLASLDISYVLSVSRCCPQPSFLLSSRYLRIPIDDSLWDDLLPWIPQALNFIDAAMSSGASVLVHCAAGISRSPALAVAYVMYSLEMDLDHAYRFVKERRPTISPNFNFLGQLQHFQSALSQKMSDKTLLSQKLGSHLTWSSPEADAFTVDSSHQKDTTQQRHTSQSPHLTLSQNPKPCENPALCTSETQKPDPKALHLHLPSSSASLLEKRKSLTLSLTPVTTTTSPKTTFTPPNSHKISEMPKDLDAKTPSGTEVSYVDRNLSHSQCSRTRVKDQGLLSPFSITLNKLLDWGEKVLLAGAFIHPVKMGQPTLPYKC